MCVKVGTQGHSEVLLAVCCPSKTRNASLERISSDNCSHRHMEDEVADDTV